MTLDTLWIVIKKKIKWHPKTNFEKGIKLTFDWYTNHKTYYNSLSKKDIRRLERNDKKGIILSEEWELEISPLTKAVNKQLLQYMISL